jgi:hypothetical protein
MNSMTAFLLLLVYFIAPAVNTVKCGRFPEVDFRKSHDPTFRRKYVNYAWGYRVRLPRNITAYGEPPPQPAHGVGIILSWEPRPYLYIDGSGNAMLFADTATAADSDEEITRKESTGVRNVVRNRVRLGKHGALRVRITHDCGSATFVTDEIILLRRNIVYTVSLTSPTSRYKTDKRVLDAIARSFKLTPLQ